MIKGGGSSTIESATHFARPALCSGEDDSGTKNSKNCSRIKLVALFLPDISEKLAFLTGACVLRRVAGWVGLLGLLG